MKNTTPEMTLKEKEDIIAAVLAGFQELADAAKAMDHTRYFAKFDLQNFTALNADGSVLHSYVPFEELFLQQVSSLEKYNSLDFTNVKVSVLTPLTCVLVNEYKAEVELRGGSNVVAAGAGTQVWCKASGTWLLAHISSSSKPA